MIVTKSHNQYVLFPNPFDEHLDSGNRWVKFSAIIPWDKLAHFYYQRMDSRMGAGALDARIVLGALIIKHHENLSDEGCIEAIQENLYMQYLLGLPSFKRDKVFAPSLFVEIRKRLGLDYWQEINSIIISHNTKDKNDGEPTIVIAEPEEVKNKGTINLDATALEQDITYPTDLKILNSSREHLEKIIDTICETTNQPKPRTYRNKARQNFLNVSKKRKCSAKLIYKANGKQLSYVCRDLKYIDKLLEKHLDLRQIINHHQLRYLQIIQTVFEQQSEMHKNKTHQVADRIVSLHQPHVRPIVRGKAGKDVEFGSKIGICVHNGLTYLDNLQWNNYNEAEDLKVSVENFKCQKGYYPEKINADQKYITKENRNWCKERNIWLSGKPLGRPTEKTKAQHKALKQSASERNCVEGKFGQAKRWYINGKINAKLRQTSESMIGAVVVVLNLIRLVQQHAYTFLKQYFEDIIDRVFNKLMNTFKKEEIHSWNF